MSNAHMDNINAQRKKALRELLIWLTFIWIPVLYIYQNTSRSSLPPPRPPIKQSPVAKPAVPTAKQEQPMPREYPTKKQKSSPNITTVPRPSLDESRKDEPFTLNDLERSFPNQLSDSRRNEGPAEELSNSPAIEESQPTVEVKGTNNSGDAHTSSENVVLTKREYKAPDNPYLAMVQRRISREWNGLSVNDQLEAVVRFKLDRSGHISDVEIEQSSGNEYFDLEAHRAVLAATPLPAFYAGMHEDFINTHLRFSNKTLQAH